MSEYKDEEYYKNLDKRTKEYKEWKARFEEENSTGLGDVVEKVTKATGIKKVVEFVAGEDCGCEEIKKKLNNLRFKGRRKVNCLTEEEYNGLKKIIESGIKSVTHSQISFLDKTNARVFNVNEHGPTTCDGCVRQWYNDLKEVFDQYGGTTV